MRLFLGKDAGAVVREKQAFGGDDTKADALIAAYLAAHPGWTATEVNQATFDSAVVVVDPAQARADAITQIVSDPSSQGKAQRGVLLLAMNENNLIREWLMAFKATVGAATTLADLQVRVAALAAMPDRTPAQLKAALPAILNGGTAD